MTRGILIFAFDNKEIKYSSLADWSAGRIRRFLDLPTTVVTDSAVKLKHADVLNTAAPADNGLRWFEDLKQSVPWANKNRFNAYALSPYDETVLLDADYIVNSDTLLKAFTTGEDILPMGRAFDITNLTTYQSLNQFGGVQFPMSWATCVYFRRSTRAQLVFEMMQMIQDNWDFYRYIYKINKSQYRNDFALSIAMNTVHGNQGRWPVLPWNMASLDPEHHLTTVDPNTFEIKFIDKSRRLKRITVTDMDFHAMGKNYLGELIANC